MSDAVERTCSCGRKYVARIADLNRGWGKSCSKRCAAFRRGYGYMKVGKSHSTQNNDTEQSNEDCRIAGMDGLDHDWSIFDD